MRYIAYCRKSTDEKDKQVLSIEAQVAELQEFAKREHLDIVEVITESKTAKVPGRQQFEKVLKIIETDHIDGILSWHPDRLARNSIDGGKIIYLLDIGKLKDLKFPSFWFENTPQGKFMLNIAFGQSKYYVDNLSENVKRGNRQKLRNGVFPSKAPYGYINNRQTKTIDIQPETARIVKKAFELFAEGGHTFTEIAGFMGKYGMKRKSGKVLHINQIRRMLADKFYIGIMKYVGEYYPGSHKLFIPKELFRKVQRELEKYDRPHKWGHDFAFMGLATCAECGASITAEVHHKFYPSTRGKVSYVYYRCTKKLKPCSQPYIPESLMADQLKDVISSCSLHPEWESVFEQWAEKELEKERTNSEVTIQQLDADLTQADQKMNRLLDAYLDQVIEPGIYKQKKNQLFDEKLKLQEQIATLRDGSSSWLEPTRETINNAIQSYKIARAKNTCSDLAIGAKTVGSNYSLADRHLSAAVKKQFLPLVAARGVASRPPNSASVTKMVTPEGIEPSLPG